MNIVYVLLGISPESICNMPTFRNHVSVPSSKAGSRLCGVRKGEAIYTVAGNGTGASHAIGRVRHWSWGVQDGWEGVEEEV
jgi:hypothetical protein